MERIIIVNYGTLSDKNTFMAENADMIEEFKIVWVNDRQVDGVRVEIFPDTNLAMSNTKTYEGGSF